MAEVAPASDLKVLECDVSRMSIGLDGIDNYYWPISNQERTGFALALVESYTKLIYKHRQNDPVTSLPYQFFGLSFLTQVVALFQGDLLRERAQLDKVQVSVPDDWHYWPSLLREETPPEPILLKTLQVVPERQGYTKKIFSFQKLKKLAKFLDIKKMLLVK